MTSYRTLISRFALLVVLLACCFSIYAQAQSSRLIVKITDVHNAHGQVEIGLWASKDGFPKDSDKRFRWIRVSILQNTASASFDDIPYGVYAVAVYHDENNNGKMDTRWPGIPTEGTGVSNNVRSRISFPSFDECKFDLGEPEKTILITMLY